MAVVTTEVLVSWLDPQAANDPFRYGWRYVKYIHLDGTEKFEQMPLTLEDVLHPQEEDFIAHSYAHQRWCFYLSSIFRVQLADDPRAIVLRDVRVAWDVPELRPFGPDIAVIFGVRERQNRSTFYVAEEGVSPALIVEVTSPETAVLDRSAKLEGYELAGVPIYVIVDAVSDRLRSPVRLLGYELRDGRYQMLPLNERGWLWLDPVRVWLGVDDGEIICYDEALQPLLDYPMLVAARIAAERRIEELEARIHEMEAELRHSREGSA